MGTPANIIGIMGKSLYDPDAQAFITAAGITDATQKSAINTLVVALKNTSIWTKFNAIYPMVGGTATTHKFNLKDPRDLDAAFRLSFVGGWTHSLTGALPNGTTGYANTFLNASSNLTNASNHLSYYSRTSTVGVTVEMGVSNGAGTNFVHLRNAVNYVAGGAAAILSLTNISAAGFYMGSKTATNSRKGYRNGVNVSTSTTNDTTAYPSLKIALGARNDNGTYAVFSAKECAFATIGDGLNDTEATNLYNAVQTFNTSLSRQV
jgi:hypothetical protein